MADSIASTAQKFVEELNKKEAASAGEYKNETKKLHDIASKIIDADKKDKEKVKED